MGFHRGMEYSEDYDILHKSFVSNYYEIWRFALG